MAYHDGNEYKPIGFVPDFQEEFNEMEELVLEVSKTNQVIIKKGCSLLCMVRDLEKKRVWFSGMVQYGFQTSEKFKDLIKVCQTSTSFAKYLKANHADFLTSIYYVDLVRTIKGLIKNYPELDAISYNDPDEFLKYLTSQEIFSLKIAKFKALTPEKQAEKIQKDLSKTREKSEQNKRAYEQSKQAESLMTQKENASDKPADKPADESIIDDNVMVDDDNEEETFNDDLSDTSSQTSESDSERGVRRNGRKSRRVPGNVLNEENLLKLKVSNLEKYCSEMENFLTIVLEKLSVDVLEALPPRPRCLQEQANDLGDAMANNMNLGAEESSDKDIEPGTRVKALFDGKPYGGFVRAIIKPFTLYEIEFDDGESHNMQKDVFTFE